MAAREVSPERMRRRESSPAASGWLRLRSMRWSCAPGTRRRTSSDGGGALSCSAAVGDEAAGPIPTGARSAMESVGYSGGAEGAGQGFAFDDGEEEEGEPRERDAMGVASAGGIYSSPEEEGKAVGDAATAGRRRGACIVRSGRVRGNGRGVGSTRLRTVGPSFAVAVVSWFCWVETGGSSAVYDLWAAPVGPICR